MMRALAAGMLLAVSSLACAAGPFSRPVTLRGTLGDAQVQLELRPKSEFEGGIEGSYFMFGDSRKILLAGETDEQEFSMEESENGTDVSGQWYGKLDGDAVSGEWASADGAVSKPFKVRIVQAVAAKAEKK